MCIQQCKVVLLDMGLYRKHRPERGRKAMVPFSYLFRSSTHVQGVVLIGCAAIEDHTCAGYIIIGNCFYDKGKRDISPKCCELPNQHWIMTGYVLNPQEEGRGTKMS